jgi:hypothetical protein
VCKTMAIIKGYILLSNKLLSYNVATCIVKTSIVFRSVTDVINQRACYLCLLFIYLVCISTIWLYMCVNYNIYKYVH